MIDNAWIICLRLPSIRLWWAHVIETPDASRIDVFSNGTSSGLRG